MHDKGKPKIPWTVLAATASAGDTTITLQQSVDWEVGDHIAVASTGKRHSQSENELREITAVCIGCLSDSFTLANNWC